MSYYEIKFRNSKELIKMGKGICQGLLYCGKQYTSKGGCACLTCDGVCGPTYGCPCPDCDFTLSNILYSSGQMNCPTCKSVLIRLNLLNRVNIFSKNLNLTYSIICTICKRNYTEKYLPLLYCKNCDFDMCPNCAFSKINFSQLKELPTITLDNGSLNGQGILYCGRKYVFPGMCKCGNCDGKCGLCNGCPCPTCDLILGYNIYLNNDMICPGCKNAILIKTTLVELKKINYQYEKGFVCNKCKVLYSNLFCHIYHCFKCNFDICQICAHNTIDGKILSYPYSPKISLINPEGNKNEKKEIKDENNRCSICLDKNKCMLFLPCKHVSCCKECAEKLDRCPLCRNLIESKTIIYL